MKTKRKERPPQSKWEMEPCALIWWLGISAPQNSLFHLQNPKLKTKAETCNSITVIIYIKGWFPSVLPLYTSHFQSLHSLSFFQSFTLFSSFSHVFVLEIAPSHICLISCCLVGLYRYCVREVRTKILLLDNRPLCVRKQNLSSIPTPQLIFNLSLWSIQKRQSLWQ